jgi:hypothetical protein
MLFLSIYFLLIFLQKYYLHQCNRIYLKYNKKIAIEIILIKKLLNTSIPLVKWDR